MAVFHNDSSGPIVVVGGRGKHAGKTSLVCGIIAVLPEFVWTAVKITSHEHDAPEPVWEEKEPGQATDTARYLAAGARHALLVTAAPERLGETIRPILELQCDRGPSAALIFESNRILEHVQPDLCLAVDGGSEYDPKPSFQLVTHPKNATVALGAMDEVLWGEKPLFRLAALDRISGEMRAWIRTQLQRG